jgi:Flp pilus assembly protein TadD
MRGTARDVRANEKARMMATTDEMYDEAVQIKEQGNLEGAIAKLEEVLSVDANHVLAHSALAVNLQKAGRFKEAIEHAIRVTELEPGDPFSFTQLSVIFQRCGRIPEAESAMERARLMSGHMHH